MATSTIHPHSAVIDMTLRVSGHELPLAQMGLDFVILKNSPAAPTPVGPGVIILSVDGQAEEIPVQLPVGIPTDVRRVAITEDEQALLQT